MSLSVEVTGLEELHKALKKLGGREAKRARTNAAQNAARLIAKRMKSDAPVGDHPPKKRSTGSSKAGDLKRLTKVSRPFTGRSVSVASIKTAYWGVILNKGEDSKRGITFRRHRKWIDRSVRASFQPSVDKFTADMWKQIAKQWDRIVKKRRK